MYQQGTLNLSAGVTEYNVTFAETFLVEPNAIFTQIFNSTEPTNSLWLESVVTSRSTTGFTVNLLVAPPAGGYVLSWLAGSGNITDSGGGGGGAAVGAGLPFEGLPILTQNQLPSSASFPVVVPGVVSKAFRVSWEKLLSMVGYGHNHFINQIVNATPIGRKLMGAASATSARTTISAAASVHTHVVDDLTNATVTGKSLLTSATPTEARGILDAANVVHTHTATDIADSTGLGRSLLTAASQAAARTATDSAQTVHTHTSTDLADATAIGLGLITSASTADARTQIAALSNQGWDGIVSIAGGAFNVTDVHMSKKIQIGTASVTATLNPANLTSSFGRVAFNIAAGLVVNLSVAGGASLSSSFGSPLGASYVLPAGFHVLENVGSNWIISSFTGAFGALLNSTTTNNAAKSLLAIEAEDIVDSGATGRNILNASTPQAARDILEVPSSSATIVNVTAGATKAISTVTATTLGNKLIIAGRLSDQTLDLDTIFSTAVGQKFSVMAESFPVTLTQSGNVRVNETNGFSPPLIIQPGQILEFIVTGTGTFSDIITDNASVPLESNTAWVSTTYGNDLTGVVGSRAFPFATLQAAADTVCTNIVVTPGEYTVSAPITYSTEKIWYFEPYSLVNYTGAANTGLFTLTNSSGIINVKGYGSFVSVGEGSIIVVNATSTVGLQFEAEAILTPNSPAISIVGTPDFFLSFVKSKYVSGSIALANSRVATLPSNLVNMDFDRWEATNLITGASVSNYPVNIHCKSIVCDKLKTHTTGVRVSIHCTDTLTLSATAVGTYAGVETNANDSIQLRADRMLMRNSSGPIVLHNGGSFVIKDTYIAGNVVMSAGGLTLKDCANDTSAGIVGTGGSVQNLRILGSLTTNVSPDMASVDFIGGNVHIDTTIFTS